MDVGNVYSLLDEHVPVFARFFSRQLGNMRGLHAAFVVLQNLHEQLLFFGGQHVCLPLPLLVPSMQPCSTTSFFMLGRIQQPSMLFFGLSDVAGHLPTFICRYIELL